jgi:hypothetical protein
MRDDPRIGEEIEVRGLAMNGMAGAIVETGSGPPYYVGGLDEWDREILMKQVTVKGKLRVRGATVERRPPEEEQSHGLPGRTMVLENPTWSVIA